MLIVISVLLLVLAFVYIIVFVLKEEQEAKAKVESEMGQFRLLQKTLEAEKRRHEERVAKLNEQKLSVQT